MKPSNMQIPTISLSELKLPCRSMQVENPWNPWNGSWVYSHGNLIADLLDNLVLESTAVLQKSRIYEMSSGTLGFLIVRYNAHQNAFAKALETLGVAWG